MPPEIFHTDGTLLDLARLLSTLGLSEDARGYVQVRVEGKVYNAFITGVVRNGALVVVTAETT